jgi:hypothetical protein
MHDQEDSFEDETKHDVSKNMQLAETLTGQIAAHAQDIMHELRVDSVVIIVTKHDRSTNQTLIANAGRGNHYARTASAQEYLEKNT